MLNDKNANIIELEKLLDPRGSRRMPLPNFQIQL